MARKILSLLVVMAMVVTSMGFISTDVSAASTPYMSIGADDYGIPREKVGDYYIWVDDSDYGEMDDDAESVETLKCGKTVNGAKALKTLGDGEQFGSPVVTNGSTIYYSVFNYNQNKTTLYKTTVSGSNHTVIKTFKNTTTVEPVAVYDGRLYYEKEVPDKNGNRTANIYSMNLSTKAVRTEKKGTWAYSSYGRYIVCDNEFKNVKTSIYNAKTRKSTSTIKSFGGTVYDGNVYHLVYTNGKMIIKKTNLSGKVLKTYPAVSGDYEISYVGKKAAYAYNYDNGLSKKLNYNTAKWTQVATLGTATIQSIASSGYDSIKLTWKTVDNAEKYKVYRATSKSGSYKLVKTTAETTWKNAGLTTGKTYYYKVRAVKGSEIGNYSAIKSAKPIPAKTSTSVTLSGDALKVKWDKVAGATGYQVYRKTGSNGSYTSIKTTTSTSLTNKNLTAGKTYYYKVRAYVKVNDKKVYGNFSTPVSYKIPEDVYRYVMLDKINEERAEVGAAPLELHDTVNELALIKAKDLYKTGYFSHYSENLGYFYDQYDEAGLSYWAGGENIAYGSTTVAGVMEQWMNSKGHRENILNEDYTHIGIGYYKGYWVQQFITPL